MPLTTVIWLVFWPMLDSCQGRAFLTYSSVVVYYYYRVKFCSLHTSLERRMFLSSSLTFGRNFHIKTELKTNLSLFKKSQVIIRSSFLIGLKNMILHFILNMSHISIDKSVCSEKPSISRKKYLIKRVGNI